MLTTLLPPTAGRATVAGFDVAKQGPQVRASIGAALQEAALDPFLTGREHLRLQSSLHGIGGQARQELIEALLERVGLTHAGDRKVRTYSGGMKRRLDLALALIHDPSILFLDEPTTGLDPQSRTALWEEVGRLAREEGVTVFLTTQYLEEADVLADRVGIIDHGRIVAEGTPAQLKSEIGKPTVEIVPESHDDLPEAARRAAPLRRRDRSPPGRLRGAGADARCALGHRPRARRRERARGTDQPARAEPRRRLPREDGAHARRLRRRMIHQIWLIARRSVVRTFRQPGVWIPPLTFPLLLMAINSNGLRAATHLPGFPTHSFLAFFMPFAFIQGALFASAIAGTDLARDIDTGFLNRLALTPVRGSALLIGEIGGAVGLGALQAVVYLGAALIAGVHIDSGVPGAAPPARDRRS